ncbi:MAG TPA: hypothetical protein VEZ55_11570 [Chitinophagaceae bacterium]|jgi:hypothetical protein|nr:hypothetical protein [Chitinophagaceae bacterium]
MLVKRLFIGNIAVGYQVMKHDNKLHFIPKEYSVLNCTPPEFIVALEDDEYVFVPRVEGSLREQVLQNINSYIVTEH